MNQLCRIANFYIQSSVHVAVSGAALVIMTQVMFEIPYNWNIIGFAFFGIIVGYNFVKYDALARIRKRRMGIKIKTIAALSLLSFLGALYCFVQLKTQTRYLAFIFLGLTMLYTLPFFPNRRNARNWAGIKIYIVALCWVGVTLIMPVWEAEIPLTSDFYLRCVQRFLFIFVLILIFEIIDLQTDDPHLQTVPQLISVPHTKSLGVGILLAFYFLEFLRVDFEGWQVIVNAFIASITAIFLFFATPYRSKYYSLLWVELLPVFWLLLMLYMQPETYYY